MELIYVIIIVVGVITLFIAIAVCVVRSNCCGKQPHEKPKKSVKKILPPVYALEYQKERSFDDAVEDFKDDGSGDYSELSRAPDPVTSLPVYHESELPYEARPDLLSTADEKDRFKKSNLMDMLYDPDREGVFTPHRGHVPMLGETITAPRNWKPRLRVMPPLNSVAAATIPDEMILGPINRSRSVSTRDLSTVTRGRGDMYWKPPLHAASASHVYLPTQLRSRFHHLGPLPTSNDNVKPWRRPNATLGREEPTFMAPDLAVQRQEEQLKADDKADAEEEDRYNDYLRRHPEAAPEEYMDEDYDDYDDDNYA